MEAGSPALTAQILLEHEHFVRAVARGLLGDAHAAEDVVQETWLRAFQGGPRAREALRGWLGSVARNLARDARRGATRRTQREERVARVEAQASVDVACERLALQRDVVAAILELDEPYRSVVLLRYYHELEPREIAVRLAAKPATVRTQLVRAHELLRARLDSRYRRESWAALLLPAMPRTEGTGGGLKVLLLGAGSAAAVAVIWTLSQNGAARTEAPVVAASSLAAASGTAELEAPSKAEASRTASAALTAGVSAPALAPPQRTRETISPRAELYARSKYDDYENATFSFELGLRNDPQGIVGNDWDVEYSGPAFDASMVVDDVSRIVDLGALPVTDLWAWTGELRGGAETAPVAQGHTYFLWSRDGDTDLAIAFEVLELVPGDRCVLEWYSTADGETARASFHDESPGHGLAARLLALRRELRRPDELRTPRVLLQGRKGAGGGNSYRIDVAGECVRFERAPTPLDPFAPLERNEEGVAYCEGGFIPEGKAFVVTRAAYWGTAKGDRKGFALVIGGERVAESDGAEPISGTWFGRIEILPGQEMLSYLELRNTSTGEAELFGELVDRPGLIAQPPPPKARKPGQASAGDRGRDWVGIPHRPAELRQPRATLQGRNGAGGGNPFCVKLDGSLTYFRQRAEEPLDLLAPLDTSERGVAYCAGGVVPEGQVFVVTRVDYWGFARGDSNGDGGFRIVIAGERIVDHEDAEPTSGTWFGRVEVPAGAETRTYLELCNSSAGEAILSGHFADASGAR